MDTIINGEITHDLQQKIQVFPARHTEVRLHEQHDHVLIDITSLRIQI